MGDRWTYFLTSMPASGRPSPYCDYCNRHRTEHREDGRCPIPNCTLGGPPRAAVRMTLEAYAASAFAMADEIFKAHSKPDLSTPNHYDPVAEMYRYAKRLESEIRRRARAEEALQGLLEDALGKIDCLRESKEGATGG